jgi:hypothetical protein
MVDGAVLKIKSKTLDSSKWNIALREQKTNKKD